MNWGLQTQLQTIDLLIFWDIEKVGDLFFSQTCSQENMLWIFVSVWDVITGSVFQKFQTLEDFCCGKWRFFSVEGKYFSFEIGKWLIFVWNNRNVADFFLLEKWLYWLWEGKWRMVLGAYLYRDMADIFKVKKWLVFLSRYI